VPFTSFLTWLQTTSVASTIGESILLTGFLSAIHLVGLTLLVGAVLVTSLRMLGIFLTDLPVNDVARGPERGMLLGLAISLVSGVLLFAPRAPAAAESSFFQIKMLTLVAAIAFHFSVYRGVARRSDVGSAKVAGGLGLMLWFGVAIAGCLFILLE
jgi:hypothetical protein